VGASTSKKTQLELRVGIREIVSNMTAGDRVYIENKGDRIYGTVIGFVAYGERVLVMLDSGTRKEYMVKKVKPIVKE